MWLDKLKRTLKDPYKLRKIARMPQFKLWVFFVFLLGLVYLLLSDGDFSFLLTLSSTIQMFAFIGIIVQLWTLKEGLSFYTFLFYALIMASRLSSTLFYEGYLPFDSSGDWFYQTVEIASLCMSSYIAFKLKNSKENVMFVLIPIPFLVLASISHPTLNSFFFTDILWAFSMYLEAVALYPQITLIKKRTADLESFSSHFVAAQAVNKVLSMIFWVLSYQELNIIYTKYAVNLLPNIPGYLVLVSQLCSFYLTVDFFYYYVKR